MTTQYVIRGVRNGVAKIVWRDGMDPAYAEVDERYECPGDSIDGHRLTFNGGDRFYDVLASQFSK